MNYKHVVFDLDGTVADTSPGIFDAYDYATAKIGVKIDIHEDLGAWIGPTINKIGERLSDDPAKQELFVKSFRECYKESMKKTYLYDGMRELLDSIKDEGGRIYIATCKIWHATEFIVDMLGLKFDGLSSANDVENRHLKTEIIRYGAENFGYTLNKESVMIGDSYTDISAGKECGMDTIAVMYGYGNKKLLLGENPDHIADTVQDLYKLIGV